MASPWRLGWLALLGLAWNPAMAQPCEGRYPRATPFAGDLRHPTLRQVWGRENVTPQPQPPVRVMLEEPWLPARGVTLAAFALIAMATLLELT